MLTAIFSLSGALVFGGADFLGGLAAKRMSALLVTGISAVTGLVVLLLVLPLLGGQWRVEDVWWGVISGMTGAIAISLLYASLAIGPMSILSPLTAVISAIVPMIWGLVVGGEQFAALGYVALGIALVAIVLVGFVPEKGAVRPSLRGLLMAVGSGTAIGAFFIVIDQTSEESGLVPLVLNRGVTAVIMFAALGVLTLVAFGRVRRFDRRADASADAHTPAPTGAWTPARVEGESRSQVARQRTAHPPSATENAASAPERSGGRVSARRISAAGVRLAIACGVVDVTANVLLLVGIRAGDLSVAAVLGAMYPAGTILLAAIVLKERIAPVQYVGLVLALAAAGMLAVA